MYKLNFPDAEFQVTQHSGKLWIFDRIRKKTVVLTPEEWVRQHLLVFLTEHRGCPRSMVQVERGLMCNGLPRRVDVLVFNRQGKPWLVAECKAPYVELDHDTAMQLARYNMPLRAQHLLLTNGMEHYCYAADYENNRLIRLTDIPAYQ